MKGQAATFAVWIKALVVTVFAAAVVFGAATEIRTGGTGYISSSSTTSQTSTIGIYINGTLVGSVSIGPCCPVEQIGHSCCSSTIYTSRNLELSSSSGSKVYIPLRSDGSFNASVAAGNYSVSLGNCTYIGCRYALPKGVTITAGDTTILNISIDTGIR